MSIAFHPRHPGSFASLALALAFAPRVHAQCSQWESGSSAPGVVGTVDGVAEVAGPGGRAVYFSAWLIELSGDATPVIFRRDGPALTALPAPVGNAWTAGDLSAFDDGAGPALYLGGEFRASSAAPSLGNVLKWTGASWVQLSTGFGGSGPARVEALAAFDHGTGPKLHAAGGFLTVSSQVVNHVAEWTGAAWVPLGTGVDGDATHLVVHDDGSGSALYVAGAFTHAGGVPADGIARWNGTSWSAVGAPLAGPKSALASLVSGSTRELFVVADAPGLTASASSVLRWDGVAWSSAGAGLAGVPNALCVHDDGTGPALFAGGWTPSTGTGTQGFVARWNGSAWTTIATTSSLPLYANVFALASVGAGPQRRLVAAGRFPALGGVGASAAAEFDGAAWAPVVPGAGLGYPAYGEPRIRAFALHDDGTGRALFAAGEFRSAGDAAADHVARFDGTDWRAVGGGFDAPAWALCVFDDGGGPALYAGGDFTAAEGAPCAHVARWNGTSWSALGAGLDARVERLVVHDDGSGPALYAAGLFANAGGAPAAHVARWNGASWSPVGAGLASALHALCVHDFGAGPELVAGGDGGTAARWNGSAWTALANLSSNVNVLASLDDGSGRALWAGVTYLGTTSSCIQRWNGTSWGAVGGVMTGPFQATTSAFLEHDDGGGPAIYAAGSFTVLASPFTTLPRIARWDGQSWSAVGSGLGTSADRGPEVSALAAFDAGNGAALYAGGVLRSAGGVPASGIARWSFCDQPWRPYCFGDGSGTACPCGNSGATGRGCRSSTNANGARLALTGSPSLANDTSTLVVEGLPATSAVLFLQGSSRENGGLGVQAFDGLRCVSGTLTRLATRFASAGVVTWPEAFDPRVSVRGGVTQPGARQHYQAFYRDPNASFCPPATANWSNAISVTWRP